MQRVHFAACRPGFILTSLLFILSHSHVHGQQCLNESIWTVLNTDPELATFSDWSLGAQATIFPTSNPNRNKVSIRAVKDESFLKQFSEWAGTEFGPNDRAKLGDLYIISAVWVYQGKYTIEDFEQVPSVNSLLGITAKSDLMLGLDPQSSNNSVFQTNPYGLTGNILEVIETCDGILYKVDSLMFPFPSPDAFMAWFNASSISNKLLVADQVATTSEQGSDCVPDRIIQIENIESSVLWMQAVNRTGMLEVINDPLLAATIFMPTQSSAEFDGMPTPSTIMYSMVRGEFCLEELLAAGSMNSMLGEVTNQSLPLRFSKSGDDVIISGDLGSTKIISGPIIACHTVIYIIDLPLDSPTTLADTAAPAALPTRPIRYVYCNPATGPSLAPAPAPAAEDSGSSALAIGLGVGLGSAALLFAAAGSFFYFRHKESSPAEKYSNKSNTSPDSLSCISIDQLVPSSGDTRNGSSDQTAPNGTVPYRLVPVATADLPSPNEDGAIMFQPSDTSGSESQMISTLITSSAEKTHSMETSPDKAGSARSATQISRLESESGRGLWEIDFADIQIAFDSKGRPVQLGRGSYGTIYRGTLRSVQPAAIKVMNPNAGTTEAALELEAAIMKHINRDRNIVQLYGTSRLPDGRLCLVTELMEGGDLREALSNPKRSPELKWNKAGKSIALDIARGLTALHAVKVVHRDLKSKNVLLTENLTAKIGDVGIAAVHSKGYLTTSAGEVMGTLAWSAPELLLNLRCTEKVDIYSMGVVLFEIATGEVPQRGFLHTPEPSEECPAALVQLIGDCIKYEPEQRPTAKEVYEKILAM